MNTLVINDLNFLEVETLNDASVYGKGFISIKDFMEWNDTDFFKNFKRSKTKKGNNYEVFAKAKGSYAWAKVDKKHDGVSSYVHVKNIW